MKKTAIGLILILAIALVTQADDKANSNPKEKKSEFIDTTEIIWYPYDKGLKLASERDRPVLINFTTAWCGYCKKMKRTTFLDAEIIRMLNNDFVSIKVDGDSKNELDVDGYKITERNLTRAEYGVRGYPTYWFLKSNAEKIGPTAGYKTADQFLEILYYIRDKVYDKMKFEEYLKNGGRKGKY